MGSDTELDALAREAEVSIHAPTWGATRLQSQVVTARQFQSTLPHGERPAHRDRFGWAVRVSIHAPTWGATRGSSRFWLIRSFNPRSHMGSDDQRHSRLLPRQDCFNPRSHMGSDAVLP